MNLTDPQKIIDTLQLKEHPEGGYYRESFRSSETISLRRGERAVATSIFYLLRAGDYSAWHRIASDELWFFHAGSPLSLNYIDRRGVQHHVLLGNDPLKGQHLSWCVEKELWFSATPAADKGFSLVSCVVAPGFDFADFELADQSQMPEIRKN